jgi:hypothetical protein
MATFSLPAVRSQFLLVSCLLSGALAGGLSAAPKSSLPNLDSETDELRSTVGALVERNDKQSEEIAQLKEKLAVADANGKRLTEAIAEANAEAEVFRRQTGELKLKLEALGVAAGSGNTSKLEQRLLTAVNNLRHSEDERKKLIEALIGLVEASMNYQKLADKPTPEAKKAVEHQIAIANQVLGTASGNAVEAPAIPATLTDGLVIDTKDDLSLIVANIGTQNGVAVGMPFQVIRGDHIVGLVRVVDARERIAGAIIQNLSSEKEKIKVGDRLKVAARQ